MKTQLKEEPKALQKALEQKEQAEKAERRKNYVRAEVPKPEEVSTVKKTGKSLDFEKMTENIK